MENNNGTVNTQPANQSASGGTETLGNISSANSVAASAGAGAAAPDENIQILRDMKKMAKKQLMYQRVASISLVVVAVLLLYTVLTIVPQVTKTLGHINDVATGAQQSLANVDGMIADISNASTNLNKLVDDNAETLTSAVKSLSEIDFEGLNQGIKDLQDAIGPMATFMNRFR